MATSIVIKLPTHTPKTFHVLDIGDWFKTEISLSHALYVKVSSHQALSVKDQTVTTFSQSDSVFAMKVSITAEYYS